MKKKLSTILFRLIFRIWNFGFLLIACYDILLIGPILIWATVVGLITPQFLVTLVGAIAVTTVCVRHVWRRLDKQPPQLMRLLYGVEIPLFLFSWIPLFLLRELNPASALILGTVFLCILAFLLEMHYGYAKDNRAIAWLQMSAHSLMVVVGIYIGAILVFYAVPAATAIGFAFLQFWPVREPGLILNSLAFIVTCLLLLLFLHIPFALARFYIQSGHRILRAFAAEYGEGRAIAACVGVLTVWTILLISFGQQPQIQAFKLLEKPPQTDSAIAKLLAKSEVIRTGLVNAYLSDYRYLGNTAENNPIRDIYSNIFNLPEWFSQFLQNSYNNLMSPFLYNGSRWDIEEAEKLYAQFFDTPIAKAEQPAIKKALQSMAILNSAKGELLNSGEKKIWLRSQQVTVKPQGDWADVEIYEEYENQTSSSAGVFYSFTLPESASLTGVWLGDSESSAKRSPFQVLPRGAAQKVYSQALLEQLGPRHYRLRFEVVPPLTPEERRNSLQRPTETHLWLTYKVMRQSNGWALPKLEKKRNIVWTKETNRIRNGKVVKGSQDDWLEAFLPADGQYQPKLHQVDLPDGYRITALPLTEKNYSLPSGKRFAVVLDTSRSMSTRTKELTETFKWLKERGFADNNVANNDGDLYVTASFDSQPKRIDIEKFNAADMTFYGSLQIKAMLQQFVKLRGDTPYDGILLVTDKGSYDVSDDTTLIHPYRGGGRWSRYDYDYSQRVDTGAVFSADVPVMSVPLWMVHLGGMPRAYDDTTLKAIQDSGGGVSAEIAEVLQPLAILAALSGENTKAGTTSKILLPPLVSVGDGYAWFMEKAEKMAIASPGFDQLAARQLVLGLSKNIQGNQLAQLDAIHAIAKTYKIVTPYSSISVLDVRDPWQNEQLKQMSAQKDRFSR